MTHLSSYLVANAYSAFAPAFNTASAICYSNGQAVPCAPGVAVFGILTPIIFIAFLVLMIASLWKVFSKAGQPGWASIIPIYNYIVLLNIVKKPMWWIILLFIPFVNIITAIIVTYNLAQSFGKGGGYTLGLILLPFIFYPMLAFGDAHYTAPMQPQTV